MAISIPIAVGVAGIATSAVLSNQQRIASERVQNDANNAQQDAMKKANTDQTNANATNDANAIRDQQRQIYQSQATSNAGRSGTLLTSPLGVGGNQDPDTTGGKTAIGA